MNVKDFESEFILACNNNDITYLINYLSNKQDFDLYIKNQSIYILFAVYLQNDIFEKLLSSVNFKSFLNNNKNSAILILIFSFFDHTCNDIQIKNIDLLINQINNPFICVKIYEFIINKPLYYTNKYKNIRLKLLLNIKDYNNIINISLWFNDYFYHDYYNIKLKHAILLCENIEDLKNIGENNTNFNFCLDESVFDCKNTKKNDDIIFYILNIYNSRYFNMNYDKFINIINYIITRNNKYDIHKDYIYFLYDNLLYGSKKICLKNIINKFVIYLIENLKIDVNIYTRFTYYLNKKYVYRFDYLINHIFAIFVINKNKREYFYNIIYYLMDENIIKYDKIHENFNNILLELFDNIIKYKQYNIIIEAKYFDLIKKLIIQNKSNINYKNLKGCSLLSTILLIYNELYSNCVYIFTWKNNYILKTNLENLIMLLLDNNVETNTYIINKYYIKILNKFISLKNNNKSDYNDDFPINDNKNELKNNSSNSNENIDKILQSLFLFNV